MREAKFNVSILQSRIKRGEVVNRPIYQSPCSCGCGLMTFTKILESLHSLPDGWSWRKKFKGKVIDKTEKLLK